MNVLDSLQTQLSQLDSLHALRTLFAAWSYDADFSPVFLKCATKADEAAQENLAGDIEIIARAGEFQIIYAPLQNWERAIGCERLVISRLLDEHPFALWIFSNAEYSRWHFVNVKRAGKEIERAGNIKRRPVLRRISLQRGRKPGRTICERLALLDVAQIASDLFGVSDLAIQAAHDGAFDVESITANFYKGYRHVVGVLQRHLKKESKNANWAHEQALQTLNRLMFLRFVQHKETHGAHWLGDDPDFTLNFWKAYKASESKNESENNFYSQWLCPLFFEAFNNAFVAAIHPQFPAAIRDALVKAPYLNGGLFKRNDLDTAYSHDIPDSFFEILFDRFNGETPGFFERYNFTIAEDSPFDQEVAVDPEMIGHVYESLIYLAEIAGEATDDAVLDARGDHGIFYTQRVEIDLMGRLALYDFLLNHLASAQAGSAQAGSTPGLRDALLEWIFAYDETEKTLADAKILRAGLWEEIHALLRPIRVCDPSCGSGAFLVGMLSILDDLQARANAALGEIETPYDRCRRIIADSLYGVDVMPWAVHVAELRLWLQLLIENDVHPEELNRHYPLLPNLSYKVRCGDSLVQELGGVTLGLGQALQISPALRRELNALKAKKRRYFQAQKDGAVSSKEIDHDEKNFFAEVLLERKRDLGNAIAELNKLRSTPNLLGELPEARQQKVWDAEIARLESERAGTEIAGTELSKMVRPPFVWSLSFAEVFGDKERKGFDIVIGNPPYVRQEKIAPPNVFNPTDKARKDYKAALMKSVQEAWPLFFKGGRKLDGKSDLYIYFYLLGLKLLNERGAFAFITSNSWLDVGYGAELQEWLLRFGRVRFVFDNEVKRSFKSADVNTAIAILGRGDVKEKINAQQTARFLMWQVGFEEAGNALLWQEIESAESRLHRAEFRLRPFSHSELLAAGANPDKPQEYSGNKWGGKYLRAPEIYDVILEKLKVEGRRVEELVKGQRYLNTGGADGFFIFNTFQKEGNYYRVTNTSVEGKSEKSPEFLIEQEFLREAVKSTNMPSLVVEKADCLVLDIPPQTKLRGKSVEKYIRWGERMDFNKRSVTSIQTPWWKAPLQARESGPLLLMRNYNDVHKIFYNPRRMIAVRFYRFYPHDPTHEKPLAAIFNSTFFGLFLEIHGSTKLGQGALDTTMADMMKILIPFKDDKAFLQSLSKAFDPLCIRKIMRVSEEVHQADRRALDALVFDALGLTRGERDAVYEAVVNLVSKRLQKAGSLKEV